MKTGHILRCLPQEPKCWEAQGRDLKVGDEAVGSLVVVLDFLIVSIKPSCAPTISNGVSSSRAVGSRPVGLNKREQS